MLANIDNQLASKLLSNKLLSKEQLKLCIQAQAIAKESGKQHSILEVGINLGYIVKEDLATINDDEIAYSIKKSKSDIVPHATLKKHSIVFDGLSNGTLRVKSASPLTEAVLADIKASVNINDNHCDKVEYEVINRFDILSQLNNFYIFDKLALEESIAFLNQNPNSSDNLTAIIHGIFQDAWMSRASDIHITLSKNELLNWISYRIDGLRLQKYILSAEAMKSFLVRLKTMASIDFSDTATPQDGRLSVNIVSEDKILDVRVNVFPTSQGEELSLRLIDPDSLATIDIVMKENQEVGAKLKDLVTFNTKTPGFVLVTGATGSGKSTTLTSLVQEIDRSKLRVVSIEDPVELIIPMVSQMQINENTGLTFSEGLKSIMRADPDVIMLGELRDKDTAEIAIKAAETGHMLLTTLHTQGVVDSISRLISMMSEGYRSMGLMAISSLISAIVHQSLVPSLCQCSKPAQIDKPLANALDLPNDTLVKFPDGCKDCNFTGYYGRSLIVEAVFFPKNREVRAQISNVLCNNRNPIELLTIPGVHFIDKKFSIGNLIQNGKIDAETARMNLS